MLILWLPLFVYCLFTFFHFGTQCGCPDGAVVDTFVPCSGSEFGNSCPDTVGCSYAEALLATTFGGPGPFGRSAGSPGRRLSPSDKGGKGGGGGFDFPINCYLAPGTGILAEFPGATSATIKEALGITCPQSDSPAAAPVTGADVVWVGGPPLYQALDLSGEFPELVTLTKFDLADGSIVQCCVAETCGDLSFLLDRIFF